MLQTAFATPTGTTTTQAFLSAHLGCGLVLLSRRLPALHPVRKRARHAFHGHLRDLVLVFHSDAAIVLLSCRLPLLWCVDERSGGSGILHLGIGHANVWDAPLLASAVQCVAAVKCSSSPRGQDATVDGKITDRQHVRKVGERDHDLEALRNKMLCDTGSLRLCSTGCQTSKLGSGGYLGSAETECAAALGENLATVPLCHKAFERS
jgi:hypothetical protein